MRAKKVQIIQTESSEWDQSIILMKQINRKYRSSGTERSAFCLEKFPRRIGRSTAMGKPCGAQSRLYWILRRSGTEAAAYDAQ